MVDRNALFDHVYLVLRPPVVRGAFLNACTQAIELTAAGRGETVIEIDGQRRSAAEAVEMWKLEKFVSRSRVERARR